MVKYEDIIQTLVTFYSGLGGTQPFTTSVIGFYSHLGNLYPSYTIVGNVTIATRTATVNFAISYSSATSFTCTATEISKGIGTANAESVVKDSWSQIVINSSSASDTGTVDYTCVWQ